MTRQYRIVEHAGSYFVEWRPVGLFATFLHGFGWHLVHRVPGCTLAEAKELKEKEERWFNSHWSVCSD